MTAPWFNKAMQVALTHRPGKNLWADLLKRLGKEEGAGWVLRLAADPERLALLEAYLEEADEVAAECACEEIGEAVLDELLYFSRGLTDNPTTTRFTFSLDAARLEELYRLVGKDGLADEVEEALREFDDQAESRRRSLQARLDWKPAEPQRRVNREVSSRKYEPGTPGWLSGRLNDAPEMLGQKLSLDKAEKTVIELEKSYFRYRGRTDLPRATEPEVSLRNTYFGQGLEPRVQFGRIGESPGVEGYLLETPEGGPRVLEFPTEDGSFSYLMFDGHHRAAALILSGQRTFDNVTIMRMDDVEEKFGLGEQDVLDAIRDLHTHLYMTDEPVPR